MVMTQLLAAQSLVSVLTGLASPSPIHQPERTSGPTSPLFPGEVYATRGESNDLAMGDLNGDGIQDAVVVNETESDISDVGVLLGNQDGSFQPVQLFPAGEEAISVAVADLNGDGDLDVVAANESGGSVSVLLGLGNGQLQGQIEIPVIAIPRSVTTGDFDLDGSIDLAVVGESSSFIATAQLLLGHGDGTFDTPISYSIVGGRPLSAQAVDLNGDGLLDLGFVSAGTNAFVYLPGLPGGGFGPQLSVTVGAFPTDFVATDLNSDGLLDVAVANWVANTVSVLSGQGNGVYSVTHTVEITNSSLPWLQLRGPIAVAAADMQGDGMVDLVVAYGQLGNGQERIGATAVLEGAGDGTFTFDDYSTTAIYANSLFTPDLNHDGSPDLLTSHSLSGSLCVQLNNGQGHFATRIDDGLTFGGSTRAADLNGDSILDLVGHGASSGGTVYRGLGNGAFESVQSFSTQSGVEDLAIADLNGDGVLDVVTANEDADSVSVLLGLGTGQLANQLVFPTGDAPVGIGVGDINADGHQDIITANNNLLGTVSVLIGVGDGSFLPPQSLTALPRPYAMAVGDLNQDGFDDVVVANRNVTSASVFLNDQNGWFLPRQDFPAGSVADTTFQIILADLNRDTVIDLVMSRGEILGDGVVSVLLGVGDGSFSGYQEYGPHGINRAVAVGDFNGDLIPDLATNDGVQGSAGSMVVYLGNGDGQFRDPRAFAAAGNPFYILAEDFTSDGKIDLLVSGAGVLPNLSNGCRVDLTKDGVINFFDLSAFLDSYNQQEPAADFAEPHGQFNFFDVSAFLAEYSNGCP